MGDEDLEPFGEVLELVGEGVVVAARGEEVVRQLAFDCPLCIVNVIAIILHATTMMIPLPRRPVRITIILLRPSLQMRELGREVIGLVLVLDPRARAVVVQVAVGVARGRTDYVALCEGVATGAGLLLLVIKWTTAAACLYLSAHSIGEVGVCVEKVGRFIFGWLI